MGYGERLAVDFFGIGIWEILLILIVALVIWGPGRMVEIGMKLGRLARNLKRVTSDLTAQLIKEMEGKDKGSPSSVTKKEQTSSGGSGTKKGNN